MKIAVVGLGLIGGSICKALKKNTDYTVYGTDIDKNVISLAKNSNAVDFVLETASICDIDVFFICLYPKQCVDFVRSNINNFKKGVIITDVCGVKKYIEQSLEKPLADKGLFYVGGHPMAGKEKSGFLNSEDKLLQNASYILTKSDSTDSSAFKTVADIIALLGSKLIVSTADTHDRIIAYTSQLAHIVSSSYVKSPSIELERGFTGGSFQDMTRVALLNENMWKDLFILNKTNLLNEVNNIISNLTDYKNALECDNEQELLKLLQDGTNIKKKHL